MMAGVGNPVRRGRWRALLLLLASCGAMWGAMWGTSSPAVAADYALVLASYHPGFAWTDGQLRGLREGLLLSRPDFQLRIEYLDAKHVSPSDRTYRAHLALIEARHGDALPRLLVAQDDDALDFALRLRADLPRWTKVPLVFSGVSGARAGELAAQARVTGVFDDADIAGNIELLQHLRPGLRRIVFVHDQSRSGLAQAEHARSWQWRFPGLSFLFLSNLAVDQIEAQLQALGDGDAVIALAFNRDARGRVLDHAEAAARWGAASRVPVLVKEEGMLAPGVLGGKLIVGLLQGQQAALLARMILDGADPSTIAMRPGETRPVFASEALQRFEVDDALLPAGAEIVGRPQPLRVTHPAEFWAAVTLLLCAGIIIPLLVRFSLREARVRQAATASERNYREILHAANEAIIIHDLEGKVLEVNRRFHELYGFEPGEAVPAHPTGLSEGNPPYGEAEAGEWLRRAREEGPQLFEWRARHRSGALFWVEVALRRAMIHDQARIIAAIRDISPRKKAEAALRDSEARYDLLLRHSPVGIMHFSLAWTLEYCNDRFVDLIGAPRENIIGGDLRRLRDPSILPAIASALAGQPGAYHGEYTSSASRRRFWLDLRTAPVRNEADEVIGGIAIFEDVSERVAAEEARRQFAASLEQGIAERTAALAQANAELKEAMTQLVQAEKMAALGSLVAGVAHELNTPIGNARIFASTIGEAARALQGEIAGGSLRRTALMDFISTCSEAAGRLDANLVRAATLINDFKQLASDQSSMCRRDFELEGVLRGTVDMIRPQLARAGCEITLRLDGAVYLESYPGAIESILMNLVSNSLIHAFPEGGGGGICLEVRRSDGEGPVTIRYADNGRGMDEETRRRAFDPFFSTRFGQGGSGLGLYVVYSLVTGLLGGSLELESAPGAGMALTFTVPRVAPGGGAPA